MCEGPWVWIGDASGSVIMARLFTHPSYSGGDRRGFCLCMCVGRRQVAHFVRAGCASVKPLHFGTSVLASLCLQCVTNHCMVYSVFLWCCCLRPSVCRANAQRSLCNWSGPLKAPCHMDPSSLGFLSVHPSISFNCPAPAFCAVPFLSSGFSIG